MPRHNALHQFAIGTNNLPASLPVPFPFPSFQGWRVTYEDFNKGALWTSDSNPYEITVEGSTPAPVVAANGVSLPTLASDNTSVLLQWTTPTLLGGASTKKFYLEASVTLTAATMASNECFIGFTSDQQTTNFVAADGSAWAFDDGFGFGKLDAATQISFIARQNDVEQNIGFGASFTTAVRTTLGCYYSGGASPLYHLYRDGIFIASAPKVVYNDDAAMGVAAYCKSGTGAIQSLLVNYVLMANEL